MQRLSDETITPEMQQIKTMIGETYAKRDAIKSEMQVWYDTYPAAHFPKMTELITTDATLSKLDSFYKKLWDYHNARSY